MVAKSRHSEMNMTSNERQFQEKEICVKEVIHIANVSRIAKKGKRVGNKSTGLHRTDIRVSYS